jgi:hypothetical protein
VSIDTEGESGGDSERDIGGKCRNLACWLGRFSVSRGYTPETVMQNEEKGHSGQVDGCAPGALKVDGRLYGATEGRKRGSKELERRGEGRMGIRSRLESNGIAVSGTPRPGGIDAPENAHAD